MIVTNIGDNGEDESDYDDKYNYREKRREK
jgi:hypothetical protein